VVTTGALVFAAGAAGEAKPWVTGAIGWAPGCLAAAPVEIPGDVCAGEPARLGSEAARSTTGDCGGSENN